MKTKLIALLKTSFASKGFNAKELEEWAGKTIDLLSLTDTSTDEDLTAAVTRMAPIVDLTQSIASRQVTDATKPKPVETTPTPTPVVTPEAPVSTDPVVLALQEQVKTLMQGLQSVQAEKAVTAREAELTPLLVGADPQYKETLLELAKSKSSLSDEEYSNWFENQAKPSVAKHVQWIADNGLGGDRPTGGVGGSNSSTKKEATEAEVEAVFSNLRI